MNFIASVLIFMGLSSVILLPAAFWAQTDWLKQQTAANTPITTKDHRNDR